MSETTDPAELSRAALAELREMVGGDPEFLAELIDTFLDDGRKLVADMQTTAAAGDAPELRRAAHTLKSNCRTFGASALADLCQEIEEQAAAGSLSGVAPLVARAAAGYPGVVAALLAERPEA
jgi:HPt (histidine-containing phosphotransfer) domain-containing protein